jgi:hypothetical protein
MNIFEAQKVIDDHVSKHGGAPTIKWDEEHKTYLSSIEPEHKYFTYGHSFDSATRRLAELLP